MKKILLLIGIASSLSLSSQNLVDTTQSEKKTFSLKNILEETVVTVLMDIKLQMILKLPIPMTLF